MDTFASWISEHWITLALTAGTACGVVLVAAIILYAIYLCTRILLAIGKAGLDRNIVIRESRLLRDPNDNELANLRRDLKASQAKLQDLHTINVHQAKLLVALEENLSTRTKDLKKVTDEHKDRIETLSKRATGQLAAAESELSGVRADVKSFQAQIHRAAEERTHLQQDIRDAHAEREALEQTCAMMERSLASTKANVDMLNTTINDLNTKRDLLMAENAHLRERLEQEQRFKAQV